MTGHYHLMQIDANNGDYYIHKHAYGRWEHADRERAYSMLTSPPSYGFRVYVCDDPVCVLH